jgi:hypothetical protein
MWVGTMIVSNQRKSLQGHAHTELEKDKND